MYGSRKNPYPTQGRSLEIPRGRGVLKAKFLEEMYENKLEFPGGRGGGAAKQKPSVGGVWIFSGTARCIFVDLLQIKDKFHCQESIIIHGVSAYERG